MNMMLHDVVYGQYDGQSMIWSHVSPIYPLTQNTSWAQGIGTTWYTV